MNRTLVVRARAAWLLILWILLPIHSARQANAADEDVLQTETQKAEKRLNAWDAEQAKLDKRSRWEVPLATALILTGAAFATRNNKVVYGMSFAVGLGLLCHFWLTKEKDETPSIEATLDR